MIFPIHKRHQRIPLFSIHIVCITEFSSEAFGSDKELSSELSWGKCYDRGALFRDCKFMSITLRIPNKFWLAWHFVNWEGTSPLLEFHYYLGYWLPFAIFLLFPSKEKPKLLFLFCELFSLQIKFSSISPRLIFSIKTCFL